MGSKHRRARAFTILLYGVAAAELVLAVAEAVRGELAAAVIAVGAAASTVVLARWFWRGSLRHGPDDWRYSWPALWRRRRS